MPRTSARYLVTIAALVCAWLIAAPARAAGPSCADSRIDGLVLSVAIPWMDPADGARDAGPVVVDSADDDARAPAATDAAIDATIATVAFGASRADLERVAADLCAAAAADPNDGLRGAPMCDHRGSSVNAPAPFLETAQRASGISSGMARADDACPAGQMIAGSRPGVSHRDVPRADVHPSQPRCALPSRVVVSPPSSELLPPSAAIVGARSGVLSEVDRPPR